MIHLKGSLENRGIKNVLYLIIFILILIIIEKSQTLLKKFNFENFDKVEEIWNFLEKKDSRNVRREEDPFLF